MEQIYIIFFYKITFYVMLLTTLLTIFIENINNQILRIQFLSPIFDFFNKKTNHLNHNKNIKY